MNPTSNTTPPTFPENKMVEISLPQKEQKKIHKVKVVTRKEREEITIHNCLAYSEIAQAFLNPSTGEITLVLVSYERA